MLSETQTAYVNDYYYASLEELSQGTTRHQLVNILIELEEDEDYLACAGIKKAIEFYDIQSLTQTIVKTEEDE
jgi:hypothetical protein